MKKYWHVINIGIQNNLTYRVNFLFRAVFGFVPLLATIYLWRAIYQGKNGADVAAWSLAEMTSYYLLVTVVDALTAVNDDDWQIAADIKDGNVSQFLLKPIDYLAYRLCLFLAGRLMYLAVAAVPVAVFIFCLRAYFIPPGGVLVILEFALALTLTALLQFFLAYTMALLAFWVLEVSTYILMLFAFEYLASGHLFPLDLLPPFWRGLLDYTPFPYQLYFPINVYLGRLPGPALLHGFLVQAGWVAATYVLARVVWARGLRKYSAVGG